MKSPSLEEREEMMNKPLPKHLHGILTASEWNEQQQDELLIQMRVVQKYVAETRDRRKRKQREEQDE